MLDDDYLKDRYCRFSFNAEKACYERDWIRYADNTFEPVRRLGDLSRKWDGRRPHFHWWPTSRPVSWRPWFEGYAFSWNHGLGEQGKPRRWGDKSPAERRVGRVPYFMELKATGRGRQRRIVSRTENIDGRRETWRFKYDAEGNLTRCAGDTGWVEEYDYDQDGRRVADYVVGRTPFMRLYEYDAQGRLLLAGDDRFEYGTNGFRSVLTSPEGTTRYEYPDDDTLQSVALPGGRTITYTYDEDGLRSGKNVNGEPVEAYDWRPDGRLGEFFNGTTEYMFFYTGEERLPAGVKIGSGQYLLHYDQLGSLKVVVSLAGQVVKTVQHGPFGAVLWDSNPLLRMPLGFAGGLSDPETGLVRLNGRDYDPHTGLWTGPDAAGECALHAPINPEWLRV